MQERENPPPSVPDILARAAIAASPRVAGSLAILYEGVRDRWLARGREVLSEVTDSVSIEELERRLHDDEALDAALTAAIEAGARSGVKAKRRLLGRVVTQAVLDDARVDETVLRIGVLSQIDAPHARCLEAVHRAEEDAAEAGEIEPRAEGADRAIVQRIAEAGKAHPAAVVAALASLGLLEAGSAFGANAIVKGLTPFGASLLEELRLADDTL